MAINFPDTATQGDTFTSGNTVFEFDGEKWFKQSNIILDNLTNIDTTGKVNGDALVYNSSTDKWEPGTVSGGSSTDSIVYAIALGF